MMTSRHQILLWRETLLNQYDQYIQVSRFVCVDEQAAGAVTTWLLRVQAGDGMPLAHAVLSQHHLSDHPAGANALEPCLAAGTALGPLLVLERLEVRSQSWLTNIFHLIFPGQQLKQSDSHHIGACRPLLLQQI